MLENYLTSDELMKIERLIVKQNGFLKVQLAKLTFLQKLAGRYAPGSKFYELTSKTLNGKLFRLPHQKKLRVTSSYIRVLRTASMSYFQHPKNTSNSLLVVWTGSGRRPLMPLAIFLDGAEPLCLDVLILRSQPGKYYSTGVSFFGKDMPSSVIALEQLIKVKRYENVYIEADSLGTFPALYCLGLPKLKSVLVSGPIDPRTIDGKAFETLVSKQNKATQLPRLIYAVGSDSKSDYKSAMFLRDYFPGQIEIVKNAKHNTLWGFAKKGLLDKWLSKQLLEAR